MMRTAHMLDYPLKMRIIHMLEYIFRDELFSCSLTEVRLDIASYSERTR